MPKNVIRFFVTLLVAGSLAGCSAMKDPGFWAAMSAANSGTQGYAQPAPRYAAPVPGVSSAPKAPAQTGELLLFGGKNHNVFLGCLNCGKLASDSVWNRYGSNGSRYSDTSIWNRYGTYGSKYSDESPWNPYGQTPPVIVDRAGNFYGYFTANKYFPKRTSIEAFLQLIENHDAIMNDFDAFVDSMK